MKLDFLKRKKWVKLELANQVATTVDLKVGGLTPTSSTPVGLTPVVQPEVVPAAATGSQGASEAGASGVKTPDPSQMACPGCGAIYEKLAWVRSLKVCGQCGKHGRISSMDRAAQLLDPGSFEAIGQEVASTDPLGFPGYPEKLEKALLQVEAGDAVLTGTGLVEGIPAAFFIMEPEFMMGSLGSAAGERITRLVETALERRLPVIGFCASGGARMQEGILSLMQMAKTSAALGRLSAAGLPYFVILTDPTTGGVTASYAMLGDVILAEPGALIGFAGQRVIEQTIRQSLPEGFQRAEFLLEKGFVDRIVHRAQMKAELATLLRLHGFDPVSVLELASAAVVEDQGGEAHVS